jgi:ABC-type multidrug transport system fused ATPase/permease subunit
MSEKVRKVLALLSPDDDGRGPAISMAEVFRKVVSILTSTERRHAYALLAMILIMAFLEAVGIASIMPFMALLASPEVIETNRWLNAVYTTLGYTDPDDFLFFLGVVVFVLLVISVAFKATTTWAITHFTTMRNYSIARRLVAGYLAQPYDWFLNRHSADLGKAALSEVQVVVDKALMPMMHLLAEGALVVAILLLLVAVDPKLAFLVGGVMGGVYGAIYLVFHKLVSRIGEDRLTANEARFKVVSEAFGGIKEVKVGGIERHWLSRFDSAARKLARTQLTATIVSQMPRFLLEIIAFGGMLLLLLFLMARGDGLQTVLPIVSLYALAGYRLLPALQLVYRELTILRFTVPALNRLYEDISEQRTEFQNESEPDESSQALVERLPTPRQSIRLENVTYTYPNAKSPTLSQLNISIAAQTTVGFVGKSGSGKTTAVDIILGLLKPEAGQLRVDGVAITAENYGAWQKILGYVPQHIFLSDESIAANIAFGVPRRRIDLQAVERAARIANLHDFIVSELPNGYHTLVGERGLRLSGGQRQRIGIARALYHEPKVIIMDEATSALDNMTELAVMDAVHNLHSSTTVLLIAHRLTTVRDCDHIYLLDHGKVIGEGSYDELSTTHSRFRALAGENPPK